MRGRKLKFPPRWGEDRNEIAVCINHNGTHRKSFTEKTTITLECENGKIKINVDTGVSGIYYGI